jgi:hypothetical protein
MYALAVTAANQSQHFLIRHQRSESYFEHAFLCRKRGSVSCIIYTGEQPAFQSIKLTLFLFTG